MPYCIIRKIDNKTEYFGWTVASKGTSRFTLGWTNELWIYNEKDAAKALIKLYGGTLASVIIDKIIIPAEAWDTLYRAPAQCAHEWSPMHGVEVCEICGEQK
jgi:hypothetical protein